MLWRQPGRDFNRGSPVASVPAWLAGRSVNQLFEISGTTLAGSLGGPGETANRYATSAAVVSNFSGGGYDYVLNKYHLGKNGGHSGTTDNRKVSIALNVDAPAWRMDSPKSAAGDVRIDPFVTNLDGKPSSSHTYWGARFIQNTLRGPRFMVFGTESLFGGGAGTATPNATFGFDPATDTWDAAGTWADYPFAARLGCVEDPDTGEVYAAGSTSLKKWDPLTDTWTTTLSSGSVITSTPMVWSRARQEIFYLASGDGTAGGTDIRAAKIASGGTVRTAISFNSSAAFTQFSNPVANGENLWDIGGVFIEDLGVYLFYRGGRTVGKNVFYVVTPNATSTWDMSLLTVTGVTPPALGDGGLHNRLVWLPDLKGVLLQATGYTNLIFFRTS
jgi:hypothetical protein